MFENFDNDVDVVDVVDDVDDAVDDVDVVFCFVVNKYIFMVGKSYSFTLRFASLVAPPQSDYFGEKIFIFEN